MRREKKDKRYCRKKTVQVFLAHTVNGIMVSNPTENIKSLHFYFKKYFGCVDSVLLKHFLLCNFLMYFMMTSVKDTSLLGDFVQNLNVYTNNIISESILCKSLNLLGSRNEM